MWSIQKLVTVPVLPRSSCTAFKVKGRRNRSILSELDGAFCDGGTTRSLGVLSLFVESDLEKLRFKPVDWKLSLGVVWKVSLGVVWKASLGVVLGVEFVL